MNKEQIKEFCRKGGLSVVEAIIEEIKSEQERPKYKDANQLVYDTGKEEGKEWAFQEILDRIHNYATDEA